MAHLGVIYTLKLRHIGSKPGEYRLLGSIDGAGLRLCDVAPHLLSKINYTVQIAGLSNLQPSVTFKSSIPVSGTHRCAAIMNRHEYGSKGELNRHAQGDKIPFHEVDNQQFEVALVISASPMDSVGYIGFHVPNNRGIKIGIEAELGRLLEENYNLKLELKPVVPTKIIESIKENGLGSITFRKLNNLTGLFDNDEDQWTEGEKFGSIDLHLKPNRKGRLFVFGEKIIRYIQTKQGTLSDDEKPISFDELATFDEKIFNELKVNIRLNGRDKVMRLNEEGYSISHAFSWDLDVGLGADDHRLVAAVADLLPE